MTTEDSDDLSFSAGDMIEIVEETNADWWMGRVNGKQALFPSSYVERVQSASPPAAGAATSGNKAVYKPFGAAYQGMNAPPAPGQGVNSVGLQQADGQEQKKSKYGKFGNTVTSFLFCYDLLYSHSIKDGPFCSRWCWVRRWRCCWRRVDSCDILGNRPSRSLHKYIYPIITVVTATS